MDEQTKRFSKFLKQKQLELSMQRGEIISQSEFGRIMGVPQGSLSQWMNGTRLPTYKNAQTLANHLGNEVFDLLDMKISYSEDPKIDELVQAFKKLSEEKQELFLEMVKKEAGIR